jgi:hypothetical protein
MNLHEARRECQRWLAYLDAQREKTEAMTRIAADRRAGRYDVTEARRRISALDQGVKVYDGADLAKAVRVMLKNTDKVSEDS